jgi:RNA:NAD 2'-phosphotransferase (TPT1/KptA family)
MVTRSQNLNVLAEARDWVCDFDLPDLRGDGPPYAFPVDIDANDLRCDGYIVSRSRKICILTELTVPFEDNIERWHLEKMEKYSKALSHVLGWTFHYLILEVGCRGWIPSFLLFSGSYWF